MGIAHLADAATRTRVAATAAGLRRAVAPAAALLLLTAPPAGAWTPPSAISASANDISAPRLGFDERGRALATWSTYRWQSAKPHGHYVPSGTFGATRAPGALAFDAPIRLPDLVSGPKLYAQTRAAGLDQRAIGWTRCGQRTTLRARFGTSAGAFGPPVALETSVGPGGNGSPSLAASDTGRMLAAWAAVTRPDCSRAAIRVAVRRPDAGRFETAVTLRGGGRAERPAVAVGSRGDLLVAWHRRLGSGAVAVEARLRRPGHAWGPVAVLGTSTVASPPTVAVAQNGRAYVAWASQTLTEDRLDARIAVAVRPAGSHDFRAAQTLERVRAPRSAGTPALGPRLALTRTGAAIAWTGRDATWRVRASSAGASTRFSAAQTVSASGVDAALDDLTALPDGTRTVLWSDLDDEYLTRDVVAAHAAPGMPFGAAEPVSPGVLRERPWPSTRAAVSRRRSGRSGWAPSPRRRRSPPSSWRRRALPR